MRYRVTIQDFGADHVRTCRPMRVVRRVSLAKARRVCDRAARRGVALYGGEVDQQNWGATGGQRTPQAYAYRSAVIQLETVR
jgi:hypothetical protein